MAPAEREWTDGRSWPAAWFERDGAARMVVGRDLAVLAVNASAERMIDAGASGLSVRDGMLSCRDRRIESELAQALADVTGDSRAFVVGADGRSALLMEAFALGEAPDGPVALTLRDLSAHVEISCVDLEPIFGVTPGEHQVIVKLLQGHSSGDIAGEFGKSILTIRTHVKRAYGKIGVKTRGQLFARLLPYLTIR